MKSKAKPKRTSRKSTTKTSSVPKPHTTAVPGISPVIKSLVVSKPPYWKGPYKEGISYSSLNRFLECRERYRLYAILGVREDEPYSDAIAFGQMWHAAEEQLARHSKAGTQVESGVMLANCTKAARDVANRITGKFPASDYEIDCSYRRFKCLWPYYISYWHDHKDVSSRTPIYQEEPFKVRYRLPSGRIIILKGIFDSVDVLDSKVYVQENKTKGRIDASAITATLSQNLQTMMYVLALQNLPTQPDLNVFPARISKPIGGVRYNVVYNSGHKVGGSRTTEADYRQRIADDQKKFFHRWRVELYKDDIEQFRICTFNSIMEQLCDWYEWVSSPEGLLHPFSNPIHYQSPWGTYNSLASGWRGSYYELLTHNSIVGLRTVNAKGH